MTLKARQRYVARKRCRFIRELVYTVLRVAPTEIEELLAALEGLGYKYVRQLLRTISLTMKYGYHGFQSILAERYKEFPLDENGRWIGGVGTQGENLQRYVVTGTMTAIETQKAVRDFSKRITSMNFSNDVFFSCQIPLYDLVLAALCQFPQAVVKVPDIIKILSSVKNRERRITFNMATLQRISMPTVLKKIKTPLAQYENVNLSPDFYIFGTHSFFRITCSIIRSKKYMVFCLPFLPYVNKSEGWNFVEDCGYISIFFENSKILEFEIGIFEMIVKDEVSLVFQGETAILSKGVDLTGGAEKTNLLFLSRNDRATVVEVNEFAAIKQFAIDSEFDVGRIIVFTQTVKGYTSIERAQLISELAIAHALQDVAKLLPFDQESSVLVTLLWLPLVLLGRIARVFTRTLLKIVDSTIRKLVGKTTYSISSYIGYKREYHGEGFWKIEQFHDVGPQIVSPDAELLVQRLHSVNSYEVSLYNFFEKHVAVNVFSEFVGKTDVPLAKVREGNQLSRLKHTVFNMDPGEVFMNSQYQERDVSTSQFTLPDAMYMKYSIDVGQLHSYHRVHLPVVPTRETPRWASTPGMLRALGARNFGVAHISSRVSGFRLFEGHIDKHAELVFVPNWKDLVHQFQLNPIVVDLSNAKKTVANMTGDKVRKFLAGEIRAWSQAEYSEFQTIIKGYAKDKVYKQLGIAGEPQTVFFLGPENSGSAQCLITEARKRKKLLHQSRVFSIDGLSDTDVEVNLNVLGVPREGKSIQSDIGKFDKSRERTGSEILYSYNKLLGLPIEFLDMYYCFDTGGDISSRAIGCYMKFIVAEHTRSGLPTTLHDNTILNEFNETLTGGYQKRSDIISMITQGDDVETVTPTSFVVPVDSEQRASDLLNFVMKREVYTLQCRYNCSRFYVNTTGGIRLMYDPWKFILKFGKAFSLHEYSVINERYIAYLTLLRNYENAEVVEKVTIACSELYKKEACDTLLAIEAIRQIMSSFESFKSVWNEESVLI